MPEIFLEFIGDASPWLVPLLVVLAVWGKLNWDALNNPAKKASFDRAVGWLREDSFGQLYLGFLGGLMDRVGDWIGDRQQLSQNSMAVGQSKGLVRRVFGFNPFTAKSYEKCLWLASLYPILSFVAIIFLGGSGQIGNTEWLNLGIPSFVTGIFLVFTSILVFGFAGSFGSALVGFIALAVNFNIFIVLAIAVFSPIFFKYLKATLAWCKKRNQENVFWFTYSALFFFIGMVSLYLVRDPKFMMIILFWLLLPLVNAPLDWLSLGFTRGLLQAVRTGNHSSWRTLIWAAADLLLAFIFLFFITAILVGVTALGNAVAGKTLIEIGCILSNLKTNASHTDHWWIYFMLLSTLIPTLFHFALAGGAATLWLPRKWRTQLADGLEDDMHKTFGAWAYLTFTPVVGFILMPLGLLWSLWWLLNANGGALGTLLLSWAENLAKWADPGMVLVCGAGG